MMVHHSQHIRALVLLAFAVCIAGCRQQMADQPSYRALEASRFFPDGQSARPLVEGTIARGQVQIAQPYFTGKLQRPQGSPSVESPAAPSLNRRDEYAREFPYEISAAIMQRGQKRYRIYCGPCHADDGSGHGAAVRHGYPAAATFHSERLRTAPLGYFIDVLTRGSGKMPSYAGQVEVDDRWAIVAYIRALQKSKLAEVPIELAMDKAREELPVREPSEIEPRPRITIPTDAGSGRFVATRQNASAAEQDYRP